MTYPELWRRLLPLYDEGEAKAIVRMVLDVGFGLSLADVYADKVTQLSQDDARLLHKMMDKLVQGVPVQYVLGRLHVARHWHRQRMYCHNAGPRLAHMACFGYRHIAKDTRHRHTKRTKAGR